MNIETLNAEEAAAFLKIHPETLKERARNHVIPGVKVGRSWVFVKDDLVAYLRGIYDKRVQTAQVERKTKCHSTSAKTRRSGGSKSRSQAVLQYRKALGLPTK